MPKTLSRAKITAIFTALRDGNPEPKSESAYENAYQLLVAVVCSAQMTDKGVNRATAALFDVVKTPADMIALGIDSLRAHLKSINYYNTKARHIMALSEQLVTRHGGVVPGVRDDLESLPGVGRKSANVVLSVIFGHTTIAVDTHAMRVARRLHLSNGTTPHAVEDDLMRVIPPAFRHNAHHWIVLHGRHICTARAPKCAVCPVRAHCPSVDNTTLKTY